MNIYVVTVKLPKNPEHDPHNKKTGACPLGGGVCTDVTGEHHTYVTTGDSVEAVRQSALDAEWRHVTTPEPTLPDCPVCSSKPFHAELGPHHAHHTDYGYVLYDPAHHQDLAGGLIAEGRRQAVDGWERQWGVGTAPGVRLSSDEDDAREWASLPGWGGVVSRLVGPWEPAEQPGGDR